MKPKIVVLGAALLCFLAYSVSGGSGADTGGSSTDEGWKVANGNIIPPCNADVGITHWETIATTNDDVGVAYDYFHGQGWTNIQSHYLQNGDRFLSAECTA